MKPCLKTISPFYTMLLTSYLGHITIVSVFKTIYCLCCYYTFRQPIPRINYTLTEEIFSYIRPRSNLLQFQHVTSCFSILYQPEEFSIVYITYTFQHFKSFYQIASYSSIFQCNQIRCM